MVKSPRPERARVSVVVRGLRGVHNVRYYYYYCFFYRFLVRETSRNGFSTTAVNTTPCERARVFFKAN